MTRRTFVLPLLCSLALLAACDTPGVDPDLTGLVLEADGTPVADAAVGVIYRLDGLALPGDWPIPASPDKPRTGVTYTLPEAATVTITVLTYDRRPIRTLADEALPAGVHMVIWDATDDAGTPQPSGLYIVRIEGEGMPVTESEVFLYLYEPAEIARAPHAISAADGRFRIRHTLLPLGEVLTTTDETGAEVGHAVVSAQFQVLAVAPDGDGFRTVTRVVDWPDGPAGVDLTLTLPD
ncbi:MAG TPA: FlgD immunoglobulin-like domain containing protein [Candidatus Krumholzibacteria bacterium]|nr:FlgD immunoglobulin-like domain containing protein [Candidatus Krumholzibacteria bacterium]HRX51399.1 FlgD immunoglobulin-like domain containing protein [Candidatus Krumholzibacteria bacterium]